MTIVDSGNRTQATAIGSIPLATRKKLEPYQTRESLLELILKG
ncbi:hypothetical protein ACE1B6_07800 [Aerosakkonemataceae cyanobacterium BLCC-F154]|uniref:Uncharacterized protein n=1 Tax=Floridaenema fluviatile BLCC-F154 TaxID=3153640 RepID=A0ABV4Y9G7_9CYAN